MSTDNLRTKPWVILRRRKARWYNHDLIFPVLQKIWMEMGCGFLTLGETESLGPRHVRALTRSASHLVFPPSVDATMADLVALRRDHNVELPAVLMTAGDFFTGGGHILAHRRWLRESDRFVAHCGAEAQLALSAFDHSLPVRRIPLPVPSPARDPKTLEAIMKKCRTRWRVKPGEKMILYAGRINSAKNVHGLLHIFSRIMKDIPSRLVIAGIFHNRRIHEMSVNPDENFDSYFLALLKKLNLESRVTLAGWLDSHELDEAFLSCDAQISLTLHAEDFGYSLAEGMMRGAPTAVTAWGGGLDMIAGGGAIGIPVEVSRNGPRVDYLEGERALRRLLSVENQLWRERARFLAQRDFSVDAVTRQWRAFFDERPGTAGGKTEKIRVAPDFLAFYHERLLRQSWLLAGSEAPSPVALARCFESPRHALLGKILKTYSGKKNPSPRPVRTYCYLHPFFDVKKSYLHDPAVPVRKFELGKTGRKALLQWFGGDSTKLRPWAAIHHSPLARRLRTEGVILTTECARAKINSSTRRKGHRSKSHRGPCLQGN